MKCSKCHSDRTVKNGMRQNGKQNFKCLPCGKQLVEAPSEHSRISNEMRGWVDRLLLEKIPLAGIARVAQVSERWLQYYVNDKYDSTPQKLTVHPPKKTQLTLECDEMGSFVMGKETGLTHHIERFNNTMRQRVSRLVRSTLSFSKKLENHVGAIWFFVHHYNASLNLT